MENKLTSDEIVRVFAQYLGQYGDLTKRKTYGSPKRTTERLTTTILNDIENISSVYSFKLHLTPLPKMSEQQILDLCKVVCPTIFGDYRFSKWQVIPQYENDGKNWNAVDVKNEKASHHFQVDLIDGEVQIHHNDGDLEPSLIHNTYWQWYFQEGIAIPLYPWEKTAIELGVALDKTEQK